MPLKIGLLVGWEQSFPKAFMERVNKEPGVVAELAKVGGTNERFDAPYRVLIDRISQEILHYRYHLKCAALAGTYVINDPFWWSADDKFFGYSLAAKIGVAVPRTVMLPQKDYIPAIDKERSLRNLEYPLDWAAIEKYVGFPAILKPADGGGWKDVSLVRNHEELMRAYDVSGTKVMTFQEFIDFEEYIRCICIGREKILPIKYDPKHRCYVHTPGGFMSKQLEAKVLEGAFKLCDSLGYDMNSVEFAVRDGVPYAIDFTNPAPDMALDSILEPHFRWCVEEMALFAVKCAKEGRTSLGEHYRFSRYLPPHLRATAPGVEPPSIATEHTPPSASMKAATKDKALSGGKQ
jgi:glutathione synthase/RimK-type ligase-like ATP-grasp enzyme